MTEKSQSTMYFLMVLVVAGYAIISFGLGLYDGSVDIASAIRTSVAMVAAILLGSQIRKSS